MKILLTADPEIPVPPLHYGGIERIIYLLICGLVEDGHEVTLIANKYSEVPCELISYDDKKNGSIVDSIRTIKLIAKSYFKKKYDIIHSFGRLAHLLPLLPLKVPVLMTYQREITPRSVSLAHILSMGKIHFTGCSKNLIKDFKDSYNFHVVYNGVSLSDYDFVEQVDDNAPLVFLGRVEKIKGTHVAIEVAKKTNNHLIIAGNVPDGKKHKKYFESCIQPYIDDKLVKYIGPVNDIQKNDLLGNAKALLMPILWEEPFGIVMAEALACGTPVIGFARGSVPEVVENGVNGFEVKTIEEMAEAVGRLGEIDRKDCRFICEKTFSSEYIVRSYLDIYKFLI